MNVSPLQKLSSTLTQLDDLHDLQLVFIVVVLGDVQHLHLEHWGDRRNRFGFSQILLIGRKTVVTAGDDSNCRWR